MQIHLDHGTRSDIFKPGPDTPPLHPDVQALLEKKRIPFSPHCTYRMDRITATDVGVILGYNKYTSYAKWANKKLGNYYSPPTRAMEHGVTHEPEALKAYEVATGLKLVDEHIGFVMKDRFFGATPDGVVACLPILVEIKCPYYNRELQPGVPQLYYGQIQLQMYVTGIHRVHFVRYWPATCFLPEEIHVHAASFDSTWWEENKGTLMAAYTKLGFMRSGAIAAPEPTKRRRVRFIPVYALV